VTTLAWQIAEFVAHVDYEQLPAEVIDKAKQCVLDTMGVAVYGSRFEAARITRALVTDMGGKEEAGLIGTPHKAPSVAAALANGVSAHVADYDDSVAGGWHPSCILVPAVLAGGEKVRANGRQLLTALVVGNEVGCKLGLLMTGSHYNAGWHVTGTIGTLAAVAAAAKVLALKPPQTVNALGIAASSAGGLRQNFGTMTKCWHAGRAAAAGVTAALLAQRGYDAAADILEGERGFVRTFQGKGDNEKLSGKLGCPFSILRELFKKYPCAFGAHAAIDIILELREQYGLRPEEVAAIECYGRPIIPSVHCHHSPKTGLEAKFSMEYCVAAALVKGRVGLREFDDSAVADPAVREQMEKVRLLTDEKLEEVALEKQVLAPTRVEVRLKDGRVFSKTVYEAHGCASDPLSWAELEGKFRECTQDILSTAQIEKTIALIRQIEDLDEVSALAACVQGA